MKVSPEVLYLTVQCNSVLAICRNFDRAGMCGCNFCEGMFSRRVTSMLFPSSFFQGEFEELKPTGTVGTCSLKS
jgi:hypothetical protein